MSKRVVAALAAGAGLTAGAAWLAWAWWTGGKPNYRKVNRGVR